MVCKILLFHFSSLFGARKPMALNYEDDYVQVKYSLHNMNAEMINVGLERLKKRYAGQYRVRVLFVYPGILQVIIGTEEAVSRIGNSDFRIEVC